MYPRAIICMDMYALVDVNENHSNFKKQGELNV